MDDHAHGLLIERARHGDAQALGQLLEHYRPRLRRLAERQMGDRLRARLDASDLVQLTCLSIQRRIDEFVGERPAQFAAWLERVHGNNVRNAIRDQQRSKRAVDRDQPLIGESVPAAESSPSRQFARRERTQRLAKALAQLAPDEAQALRLRFLEERPLAEIAQQLQLTRDGLAWLLQRAMKKVRPLLREEAD